MIRLGFLRLDETERDIDVIQTFRTGADADAVKREPIAGFVQLLKALAASSAGMVIEELNVEVSNGYGDTKRRFNADQACQYGRIGRFHGRHVPDGSNSRLHDLGLRHAFLRPFDGRVRLEDLNVGFQVRVGLDRHKQQRLCKAHLTLSCIARAFFSIVFSNLQRQATLVSSSFQRDPDSYQSSCAGDPIGYRAKFPRLAQRKICGRSEGESHYRQGTPKHRPLSTHTATLAHALGSPHSQQLRRAV